MIIMIYNTKIGDQAGYLMVNSNTQSYDECVKKKSARIKGASRIRNLTINKYIPLRYLLVLLREKRLILKPVTTWEDPYENFFLKEQFVKEGDLNKSYSVSVENLIKGLYGMSWSLQDETDSLWRIYSQDKLSIRISTSVETLVKAVCSEENKWDVWIGKVHYKSEEEIENWLNKCVNTETPLQFLNKMSESFFIKRKAFVAEKEFRIIVNYVENNKKNQPHDFVCYKIDPNVFVSEYVVDPRLEKYEYEAVKAALVGAGAEDSRIRQSKLYAFKPRKVEMKYDPFWDF